VKADALLGEHLWSNKAARRVVDYTIGLFHRLPPVSKEYRRVPEFRVLVTRDEIGVYSQVTISSGWKGSPRQVTPL
jgi:hypothetical protein